MSNVGELFQRILDNQFKIQSKIISLKINQDRFEKKLDTVANQVGDLTEFKAETTDFLNKMDDKKDQIKFVKYSPSHTQDI